MTVNLDKSGGCEVLELNIEIPDGPPADPAAPVAARARAVVASKAPRFDGALTPLEAPVIVPNPALSARA